MALFAGIWHRGGGRLRSGAETDLLAALHAPFHSVLSAFDDDSFAIVARSTTEPTVVSRGSIVAALGGRLDGRLNASDVLDAYLDPAGRFRSIAGDYAIAVFDPARHTLLLMRDAVGTQPMYYHTADDGTFVFGSQIKAVLAGAALRPQINRGALAHLLVARDGVPRGQTCFAGVYSLPPGQVLFVTPDSISSTTHVDLRPIVPTPLKTFEQSAAAFKRALCASVDRRISEERRTAVLTSGGLDSSAILAAAANAAAADRLVAISYGRDDGSGADESRYVDVVTRKAGVRSVRVELEPLEFARRAGADAWSSETPLIDDVPGTLSRAATAARYAGARDIMLGTWGDQVLFPFPPPHLGELLRAGRINEYRRLSRSLGDWMSDVPRREVRHALVRQAIRSVVPNAVLRRIRPKPAQSSFFDGLNGLATQRRSGFIGYAGAVRREVTGQSSVDAMEGTTKWGWTNGLETQLPFLDADLIQLLLAIPAEHALNDGVPKALLRTAMADLVPAQVLQRRDKGDYTAVINEELQSSRQECLEMLQDGAILVKHGVMSADSAKRTLARLAEQWEIENESANTLSSLIGVDAWLRVFFEDGM